MSLRRDIHSAFEPIAPPLGGMPERVVQAVLAAHTGRRRKERVMLRARVPLTLVAVLAVVALAAAVVIGGRILVQWDNNSAVPAAPAPAAAPPGGPVPVELRGDWVMLLSESKGIAGPMCPDPASLATCTFKLTFTATTFNIDSNIATFTPGGGQVVVNRSEIDFFNGQACGEIFPHGVGRYTWNLSAQGALTFSPLAVDGCPRSQWLENETYTRSGQPPL